MTREPDVIKEIRRGNMKERWGIEVVYRSSDSVSLELAVTKVRSIFKGILVNKRSCH